MEASRIPRREQRAGLALNMGTLWQGVGGVVSDHRVSGEARTGRADRKHDRQLRPTRPHRSHARALVPRVEERQLGLERRW